MVSGYYQSGVRVYQSGVRVYQSGVRVLPEWCQGGARAVSEYSNSDDTASRVLE